MFPAAFKHDLNREGAPCREGGAEEFRQKVMNMYWHVDPRTIQMGFMRAYSRDHLGDHNEISIPDSFKEWYSDEELDLLDIEVYIEEDEAHNDESQSEETS